jgi:hypothetical protein
VFIYTAQENAMTTNPFAAPGRWYRGNLHTHTTESDGLMSPEEMVDWHVAHGYDFLSLTDHRVRLDPAPYLRDGLLLIPGIELDGHDPDGGRYHIVGLGVENSVEHRTDSSLQAAVDALRGAGGLVVLAHPYWSGQSARELLSVTGACGIEVFNGVCEKEWGKGLSSVHWDNLLAAGRRLWGLAVDDAHGHPPDGDLGQGWVMVKAHEPTADAILEALEGGAFYSSSGPEIHDVRLTGGVVTVDCSPVRCIHFMCDWALGHAVRAWEGPLLTEAQFELRGLGETYLRVECIDCQGRRAWSQPVFLEG